MTNILTVERLVKHYRGVKAVDDVSFSVQQGQCFGLLGPNGAGKTTTIEMVEGINKPSSGKIWLFGQPADRRAYHRVGIQFQNTALQDYLTVQETLALFASFYSQSLSLDVLAELCALGDFLNRDARKLSGGQRQRLLLALALINDPDLLFLDEPTTGLDPQARRNFWQLIERIKESGKTVVLTTHYMDEAEVLCDEIAIMDQGKIIEQGSPKGLLRRHFDGVVVQLPAQAFNGQALPEGALQKEDWVEIPSNQVDETILQLTQAGTPLTGLAVKNPNLEDLFIKLTGHQLRS